MSHTVETSVVVVGGSLVGLATALFLSHQSVPVVVLERHSASSPHPRALGYTVRTIEMLRAVGIDSQLPAASWTGGPPRRVVVESLAGVWQEEKYWTPNAVKPAQDKPMSAATGLEAYSPVTGMAIAQDKIEPVLRQSAVDHGADLRLGCKVTDWSQDDQGVYVTAVDKEGNEFTVNGKYLVACDGSRSAIREKLGIQRHGVGFIRRLRSILFRCPSIEKYLDKGYVQFQIEGRDDGFEGFLTTYGDSRWALMWNETGESTGPMPEATQQERIRKAIGADVADMEVITTGEWDLNGLVAATFSAGRVFLAGDAAHALPPNRGGYGANTGFGDAQNLAWKLAAVLHGAARPALLETYDAERRPVATVRHDQIFARPDFRRFVGAREATEIYDDVAMELGQVYRSAAIVGASRDGKLARRPDEWQGEPGTRAPHVSLRRAAEGISSLDLFCKGWVLLSQSSSWTTLLAEATKSCGVDCDFVEIGADVEEAETGSFQDAFGVYDTGAVLVRPDGYIAWRALAMPESARETLEEVLAQASFATRILE